VYGASDAGIYVGQSRAIVVRKNRVERNVAGIEVENSRGADVHDNVATDNAGGILVFDLPGLPVKDGGDVRVFGNQVRANNHANFAAEGNLVAIVPSGTGVMVMAMDHVEIFRNEIRDNRTVNLALVSYDITLAVDREREAREKDEGYEPYAEAIWVHDNVFAGGGDRPSGPIGLFLRALLGTGAVPDVVYDGIVNPARLVDGAVAPGWGIYLADNGDADFVDLNLGREDLGPARGPAARPGKIRRIEPVRLPGIEPIGSR
jgi:parallel beta-helix repeat protein